MTNLTNKTYIKVRDLILKSEGRTIEDWATKFNWYKDDIQDGIFISLDRVLMALPKGFSLSQSGELMDYFYPMSFHFKLGQPLHLQSEEAWEKLIDILESKQ